MFCNSFGLEETHGLRERRQAVLQYCKGIRPQAGGEGSWRKEMSVWEENGGTGSSAKGKTKEEQGTQVAKELWVRAGSWALMEWDFAPNYCHCQLLHSQTQKAREGECKNINGHW